MRIGWHMDGVTFDRYLAFTWYQRWALHEELTDMVERTQPDEGATARPKRMRKAG